VVGAGRLVVWLGAFCLACSPAHEERFITLASTTSTENSGLLAAILPEFQAKTGIEVRVVALGTGQALRLARRGDADVVMVHDRAAEDRFVSEGWGVERVDVMYNDFVLVGPKSDPAGIAGWRDAPRGLARIAETRAPFISRGDDSGTWKAERRLWKASGIDPTPESGTWYAESGSGMGATLNTAAGIHAYTLTDRGTWLSFGNRGNLTILVEGDERLFNPYGAMLVNPERHPHVKEADARAFIEWIVSDAGRAAISGFRIHGETLFHPTGSDL
jgi:tungstate transport system substrate-binding protein